MLSSVAKLYQGEKVNKKAPLFEFEIFAIRKLKKAEIDYLPRKRNH
jgi:hypothetical protein